MARTFAQLIQALGERSGDHLSGSASSNGGAAGATLITSSLLDRPGEDYVSRFIEITSGTYDGNIRQARTLSLASGEHTVTPHNAFGGQIVSGVTFLVHRIHPDFKKRALNLALQLVSPDIYQRIIQEDLLTGQCLRNGNFELWDQNTPSDWEIVSGTVTRETGVRYEGAASLGLAGIGSEMQQRIVIPQELEDVALTFTCWVHSSVAAATEIRLKVGDTSFFSTMHTGSGSWEQLTVTATPSTRNQPIYAKLLQATATKVRFDAAHFAPASTEKCNWIPYSDAYVYMTDVLLGRFSDTASASVVPHKKFILPDYRLNGYGFYDSPDHRFAANQGLRLMGVGRWDRLSADGDTVDIDQRYEDLIVLQAKHEMARELEDANYLGESAHWKSMKQNALEELAQARMRLHPPMLLLEFPILRERGVLSNVRETLRGIG